MKGKEPENIWLSTNHSAEFADEDFIDTDDQRAIIDVKPSLLGLHKRYGVPILPYVFDQTECETELVSPGFYYLPVKDTFWYKCKAVWHQVENGESKMCQTVGHSQAEQSDTLIGWRISGIELPLSFKPKLEQKWFIYFEYSIEDVLNINFKY